MSHKEILSALILGAILKVPYGSGPDDFYFLKMVDGTLFKCYTFNYGNFNSTVDTLFFHSGIEVYEQQQEIPLDNSGSVKVSIDAPMTLKAYKNGDAIIFSDKDQDHITLFTLTDSAKFERFSKADGIQNYLI